MRVMLCAGRWPIYNRRIVTAGDQLTVGLLSVYAGQVAHQG